MNFIQIIQPVNTSPMSYVYHHLNSVFYKKKLFCLLYVKPILTVQNVITQLVYYETFRYF